MNDPWKYIAFPLASIAGFLMSQTALASIIGGSIGVNELVSKIIVVGATGLVAGFLVDEVIPAYLEKVRNRQGGGMGGGEDFGGGFSDDDEDLNFE